MGSDVPEDGACVPTDLLRRRPAPGGAGAVTGPAFPSFDDQHGDAAPPWAPRMMEDCA